MEWNGKWDWENLEMFGSKGSESPKKLQTIDWGFKEGDIDAVSFNVSGGGGGYGSDVGHYSSAKSSISALTDSSSKDGINRSDFTFEAFGGFPVDFSRTKEPTRALITETSPPLEASVGSGEPLIGLKLGKRTYFENGSAERSAKTPSFLASPASSVTCGKENEIVFSECTYSTLPSCNLDLSSAKEYHRKHRVCESHSKCPKVVVGGLERRFCQQCSRFHSLAEFDEKKRSCRRRLSDHNSRRRKPQQETIHFNSARLSSSFYDGRQQMSFVLKNASLPQTRPPASSAWESTYSPKYAQAKGYLKKFAKTEIIDGQPDMSQIQLSHAVSMPHHDSNKLFPFKETITEVFDQGLKESMFSSNLGAAPDLHRALSLLSTNSWGSCQPESARSNHPTHVTHSSMPQHLTHAVVPQGLPLVSSDYWQTEQQSTEAMHPLVNGNSSSHFQEIQLFKAPYETGFCFNQSN
ncbi:LOW QUALITY PROTEIN: hypothetical protein RJ639_029217 [Escallonia herrerae]|uniref:SBP-type domain-containing protein n=1 Tax=Escallonia herrerae TaxID=1293975 RepID=A0AA89BH61_9ASTE|nr:LOW QUALITY PROTEIN: hypothetical protein RJ639_029217 [Escallonia herrerae]